MPLHRLLAHLVGRWSIGSLVFLLPPPLLSLVLEGGVGYVQSFPEGGCTSPLPTSPMPCIQGNTSESITATQVDVLMTQFTAVQKQFFQWNERGRPSRRRDCSHKKKHLAWHSTEHHISFLSRSAKRRRIVVPCSLEEELSTSFVQEVTPAPQSVCHMYSPWDDLEAFHAAYVEAHAVAGTGVPQALTLIKSCISSLTSFIHFSAGAQHAESLKSRKGHHSLSSEACLLGSHGETAWGLR